jgi:hypothetical protein
LRRARRPPSGRRRRTTTPGEAEKVGYGKPPKHTRFRPGQSGNSRSRSKGAGNIQSFDLTIEELLTEPIAIREGGKARKVPVIEATLMAILNRACGGDPTAFTTVLTIAKQTNAFPVQGEGGGYLIVPPPMTTEEWLEAAEKHQAKYRGNTGDLLKTESSDKQR